MYNQHGFVIDHVLVKVTGPWRLDSYNKTVRERPDHNTARIFRQAFGPVGKLNLCPIFFL